MLVAAFGISIALAFSVPVGKLAGQEQPKTLDSLPLVDVTEELRIGGLTGDEYELGQMHGLTVGPDGRMFVSSSMEPNVLVFSARGEPLTRIGSRGRGPGEFRSVSASGWKGDTLWVHDPAARRVSFFDPSSGRFHYSISYPRVQGGTGRPAWITPLADGGLLAAVPEMGRAETARSGEEARTVYLLVTREGETRERIGALRPVTRKMRVKAAGGMTGVFSQPLYAGDLVTVAPDGSEVFVIQWMIESSEIGAVGVVRFDPAGDTISQHRYRFRPRPVTDDDVDQLVRKFTEANREAHRARGRRLGPDFADRLRDALYVPRYHPPVTGAGVGRDGSLALRRELEPYGPSTWVLVDPEGVPVVRFRTPEHARLLEAHRDRLWLAEIDREIGLPYLVRYRIEDVDR